MARSPRVVLGLWCAAVVAAAARTQEGDAAAHRARDRARVEQATIELERFVPWGEQGLPAKPDWRFVWAALAFTGDGSHLALQLALDWTCIDVATGRATALGQLGVLTGGVDGPRVAACPGNGLDLVTLPEGGHDVLVQPSPPGQGLLGIRVPPSRLWRISLDRRRAIASSKDTVLVDLASDVEITLPGKGAVIAIAWDESRQRLALVRRIGENDATTRIQVFDFAGKEIAPFAAPGATGCELDLAGKHVFWAGPTVCRGDLATGAIEKSDGPTLTWFWQIDPVLGVGCDGVAFHLFDLNTLEAVRRIPLGEAAPADAAASDPRLRIGCVHLPGPAASRQRDRIAMATLQGIRIFAVKP